MDDRLLRPESTLVSMRPMTVDDVQYIFDIRHSARGRWLNTTSPDIGDQYIYFEKYLERFHDDDEIYYMIRDKRREQDTGIVRMTRLSESVGFGWEGLVLEEETTPGCAIDVAAVVYSMGFDWLNRETCGPWKVLKSNTRVMRMHQMMGVARAIGEDETNWLVSVTRENFYSGIQSLRRRGFGRIDVQFS